MKQILLKAPNRIQLFKTQAPCIPLPPSSVSTRWAHGLVLLCSVVKTFELFKIYFIRQSSKIYF